jgi:hypothetical protein
MRHGPGGYSASISSFGSPVISLISSTGKPFDRCAIRILKKLKNLIKLDEDMVTNKSEIFSLFEKLNDTLKTMGVLRIGLFGSFARGENKIASDVDIIVSFLPGKKTYDAFFNLAEMLEEHFGRKVEIITEESISPHLKKEIDKDAGYYEVAA